MNCFTKGIPKISYSNMKKDKFYSKQMRKVDAIHSAKALRDLEDAAMTRGRDQFVWRAFLEQQQEALGFANVGGGITIPSAVTWLSQAWDNTATYAAGTGGVPANSSFVQVNGSVYAAPNAAPASGTAPPGSTWVLQSPGPGMNAWQVNPNARQSIWANPTQDFPLPPVYTDVVDSAWYAPDQQVASTTLNQWYIPAPGIGFLLAAASTGFPILQYNLAGTWTTAFTFTATTYIPVFLDGLTWRVITAAASAVRQTYQIFRPRMLTQASANL
jgi:hypothetical protein